MGLRQAIAIPRAMLERSAGRFAPRFAPPRAIPAYLVRIFRRGSRTYFYSSLFFPRGVREDVFVLYAFVRSADDFVDQVPQDGEGFTRFEAAYRSALRGRPSNQPVIDRFVELATRRAFDPAWVDSFLQAMRADLTRGDYASLEELDGYMYGSACVVGLMMARILGLPDAALPAARQLGRAMQYVNFLRDVDEDRELGRTYVPRSCLERHGLRSLDPAEARRRPEAFAALMREEVDRYLGWQARAAEGYRFIPKRCRIPIQTAADMYAWTAQRIHARPEVVFEGKLKPSVGRILARLVINGLRG